MKPLLKRKLNSNDIVLIVVYAAVVYVALAKIVYAMTGVKIL